MSSIPYVTDILSADVPMYTIHKVAKGLRCSESKVNQLLRDRQFLAVRRGGELMIPQAFFDTTGDGFAVVRFLPGLIGVLGDGGYNDTDIVAWLFTDTDDLGAPVDVLHTDQAREMVRRAQAMAF